MKYIATVVLLLFISGCGLKPSVDDPKLSDVQLDLEKFLVGDLVAYVIGGPEEVADKLVRHSKALGGISRFTFQIDNAGLSHDDLLQTFTLIGQEVKPLVLEKS